MLKKAFIVGVPNKFQQELGHSKRQVSKYLVSKYLYLYSTTYIIILMVPLSA